MRAAELGPLERTSLRGASATVSAVESGSREGAIAVYRQYLTQRAEPEPELVEDVEAVRERLERLVGQGTER